MRGLAGGRGGGAGRGGWFGGGFDGQVREGAVEPAGQPPVRPAGQVHEGGDEQGAQDERVEQDCGGQGPPARRDRGRLLPCPGRPGALPDPTVWHSVPGAGGRVAVPGSAGGEDVLGCGGSGAVAEGVGDDRGGSQEDELAERRRPGLGGGDASSGYSLARLPAVPGHGASLNGGYRSVTRTNA